MRIFRKLKRRLFVFGDLAMADSSAVLDTAVGKCCQTFPDAFWVKTGRSDGYIFFQGN